MIKEEIISAINFAISSLLKKNIIPKSIIISENVFNTLGCIADGENSLFGLKIHYSDIFTDDDFTLLECDIDQPTKLREHYARLVLLTVGRKLNKKPHR